MKAFLKKASLALSAALVLCSCSGMGAAVYEGEAEWSFAEVSGNWTVSFPRTQVTTTIESLGVVSRVVESLSPDSTEVVSEKVAQLTDEDLARLELLKSKLDLQAQGSLELAPGCAGGGAAVYTYSEGGGEPVTFTITGGCGAELSEAEPDLAAFIDAVNEIAER